MKIALTSVADIKNYGDVLFSFIARQEILKRIPKAKFRFFTPTDIELENEHFYKYSKQNMVDYAPDAILTIGGEVIHKYDKQVWQDMYHGAVKHPSNIIFDWLSNAAQFKAWFSVGVLDLPYTQKTITDEELSSLDYIGVRGVLSKKILERKIMSFDNKKIEIIPDIGWVFPRCFKNYKRVLRTLSRKYKFGLSTNKYFVFNVNWTSIPEEKIITTMDALVAFADRHKLKLVIMDVISSYKKLNVDIEQKYKKYKNILFLSDLSLQETGSLLMGTRFFIGSSLHCAITTLATGKPAGVIHKASLTKLQDLFGHMMRTDLLSHNWHDVPVMLDKLYNFSHSDKQVLKQYVKFMQCRFDKALDSLTNQMMHKCHYKNQKFISALWYQIYRRPMSHIRNGFMKIDDTITRKKSVKKNLLIIDNFEPSWLLSGFRVKEFNWILRTIKNSALVNFSETIYNFRPRWKKSDRNICWSRPQTISQYRANKKKYTELFGVKQNDIIRLQDRPYKANGAYLMFIYNAYLALKFMEKNKIPFVFTLFPGGGFKLNHKFSDSMLKSVFASPMFRGVFVPQKIIYDYLLDKKLCPKEKIFFDYGGGFVQFTEQDVLPKLWYKQDKDTFDISFVAHKYMDKSLDKGFDLFLYAAREIVKKYPFVHFHCVGTCEIEDFSDDFADIKNNLHMYGSQKMEFFPSFYQKMDINLSPNRPFVLDKGAFDGFPLSIEAMLFGVPLFCTDELKQNYNYVDGKELVVIKPNVKDIIKQIEHYIKAPKELRAIGAAGKKKINLFFNQQHQQDKRKEFLYKYLDIK